MQFLTRLGPAFALALALAAPAAATSVVRQSLDELSTRADLIVRGSVEELAGHAEVRGRPFRLARIRVTETLAGSAPAVVWVRLPGGSDARGLQASVAGVPDLAPGDEVLLFLEAVAPDITARPTAPAALAHRTKRALASPAAGPAPREQWIPLSLSVGTYRVEGEGPAALAVQDAEATTMRQVGDGMPAPVRLRMEDVRERVRAKRPRIGDKQ